jgi:O-antigen ligase
MAVVASTAVKPQAQASNIGLALGLAGLVGFGIACGIALAMGEIQALYVTLAALACIAILVDYRIGAVLLIVLMPVSSTNMFPHQLMGITGLNPINVLIAGTLAAYVLRGRLDNPGRLIPPQVLWLYIVPILIAGAIGAPHAEEIADTWDRAGGVSFADSLGFYRDLVVKPLLIVAAALLVGAAVATSAKPERFITAIAISACALALVEFAFIILSNTTLGRLATPTARTFFIEMGMHANALGRLFITAYALLLFVWWETKQPTVKMWLTVALTIIAFAILFTFSRAAFLGFFLVNGLFLVWKFNMKKLALALFGLAIAAMLAPQYVYDRITFGFSTGDVNTVSMGRVEGIWMPLLPEVWKSPLWGEGVASTMHSFPLQTGVMEFVAHPHNAFLEALLDMGIIGLALLVAYYLHVWKGMRFLGSNAYLTPEMRAFFQGACAALIAFGLACMTGGSLRPDPENAFLWIAIGAMYGVLARRPTA